MAHPPANPPSPPLHGGGGAASHLRGVGRLVTRVSRPWSRRGFGGRWQFSCTGEREHFAGQRERWGCRPRWQLVWS
jgi:hypothetical protein